MRLSKNFSLAEFTKSQTAERKGIDNTPEDHHIEAMEQLCHGVLEMIRYHFKKTFGYKFWISKCCFV